LIAVIAVLLIGSGVALSQQARPQTNPTPATGVQAEPQPTVEPRVTPGSIIVGSPIPTTDVPTVAVPTSQPVPDSPETGPALASDIVLASYDFATDDLSGWRFDQISDDPVQPTEWFVRDGTLRGPANEEGFTPFNDTLALAPATDTPASAVEASVLTSNPSRAGLVLGYASNQDYLALIFNSPESVGQPHTGPGLVLVQVVAGEPTVLAQDETLRAELRTWYRLRLDVANTTVTASVDGEPVLTATLDSALTGEDAGLYAGYLGSARFDDLRLMGE
jgi:hypothetical protein